MISRRGFLSSLSLGGAGILAGCSEDGYYSMVIATDTVLRESDNIAVVHGTGDGGEATVNVGFRDRARTGNNPISQVEIYIDGHEFGSTEVKKGDYNVTFSVGVEYVAQDSESTLRAISENGNEIESLSLKVGRYMIM